MTSFDVPQPLRLAQGSHQPGSGKGCAMNVVSYTNGDAEITDYPECSAKPLARIVQLVNDVLSGHGGYLSPEDSVIALGLGWRTVGTANADYGMHSIWWEKLTGQATESSVWAPRWVTEIPSGNARVVEYVHNRFKRGGYIDFATFTICEVEWNKSGLIGFAGDAIDLWVKLMPITPAEPITQDQIEYAMARMNG